MLEVGNGGMTRDEYIVHFSIWAISKVITRSLKQRSPKPMLYIYNISSHMHRLLFYLVVT